MNVSKLNERSAWSRSSRSRRLLAVAVVVVGVTLAVAFAAVGRAYLSGGVLGASGMILAWIGESTPHSTL